MKLIFLNQADIHGTWNLSPPDIVVSGGFIFKFHGAACPPESRIHSRTDTIISSICQI